MQAWHGASVLVRFPSLCVLAAALYRRHAIEEIVALCVQWRQSCYFKVLAFGKSPLGRLQLRVHLLMADLFQWLALICLAFLEFWKEPRPLTIRTAASKTKEKKEAIEEKSIGQRAAQIDSMQPQKKAL